MIIGSIIGLLVGVVSAVIGAAIWDRWREGITRRPLERLLNFGPDELHFVFPIRDEDDAHRPRPSTAILPRTSTEDFLAINNLISALIKINWQRRIRVKDTNHFYENDQSHNVVVICSPKSNAIAGMVQKELIHAGKMFFYRFETEDVTAKDYDSGNDIQVERTFIVAPDGAPFRSPSWEEEETYRKHRVPRYLLANKAFDDFAMITKVKNPWNPKTTLLWIAGIRGIGTWGAAEFMKKHWQELYDELPEDEKECEFSALVRIRYRNCDMAKPLLMCVWTSKGAHAPAIAQAAHSG